MFNSIKLQVKLELREEEFYESYQDVINFSIKRIDKIFKWNSMTIYISYKDVRKLGDWILEQF